MLWFKDGDKTTVFFHAVVKTRNNSNGINILRDENFVIEDPKLIEDHILAFYKNLYVDSNHNAYITGNTNDFIGTCVLDMVSSKENIMLIKCLDDLEIRNVVFNLLFKKLLNNFANICPNNLSARRILPWMNNNVVSLIPKIQGVDSIKDSSSIVLDDFKFKIISKILA